MFGNFITYEVTINNLGHGELDLESVIGSEYSVRINPGAANVRLLITPSTSSVVADASDYLLADKEDHEFELGRGLSRLSFYNGSGGQVKVSIAVLF